MQRFVNYLNIYLKTNGKYKYETYFNIPLKYKNKRAQR